jgi:hypothetical protein
VVSRMTERERERLAADLELLGRLADPTRGPLASFFASPPPPVASKARPASTCGPLHHALKAALATIRRHRGFRRFLARPVAASQVSMRSETG